MKFLVIGLGSIGQRWVRILKEHQEFDVFAYRRLRTTGTIAPDLQSVSNIPPEVVLGVISFFTEDELALQKFDVAIICSPINLHLNDLKLCLDLGISRILIEKPLSNNISGTEQIFLTKLINKLKNEKDAPRLVVGFQGRHHPALERIRTYLQQNTIGQVHYARTEYGEWLPGMHPYEDYQVSHMSNSNQGGGPASCLSHELDLVESIFGKIVSNKGFMQKFGVLKTDVPDLVTILWEANSEDFSKVSGESRMDFVTWPASRTIEIIGSEGRLLYNWLSGSLTIYSREKGFIEEDFSNFSRDDVFKRELQYLLESNKNSKKDFEILDTAIRISKIASEYSVIYE
jgi:predicted dehydrogenase